MRTPPMWVELRHYTHSKEARARWIRRCIQEPYEDYEKVQIGPNAYEVCGDNMVTMFGEKYWRWKGWVHFFGRKLYVVGYAHSPNTWPSQWDDDTRQEERA